MRRSLFVATLPLVLVACNGGVPSRSATVFGVTVATGIPQALAVIIDSVDADGTRRQPCYAMLGGRAGSRLVYGDRMPNSLLKNCKKDLDNLALDT